MSSQTDSHTHNDYDAIRLNKDDKSKQLSYHITSVEKFNLDKDQLERDIPKVYQKRFL